MLPKHVQTRTMTAVALNVTNIGLTLVGRGQKLEGRGVEKLQPEATSAMTPIAGASEKMGAQAAAAIK